MDHSSHSPTKRLRVILLGSNPSIKTRADLAFFLDTKSGRTLKQWLNGIDAEFLYMNVSNNKTPNNRALTRAEIKESLPALCKAMASKYPNRIVALGNAAHEALEMMKCKHLHMPHPSGLNRKLNDKAYAEQKIKELAAFCTASPVVESVV